MPIRFWSRALLRSSAVRLFLTLCGSIFVVDFFVMLFIERVAPRTLWGILLLDSTTLLAALFPVLYLLVLRPLTEQSARREAADARQRRSEAELRATLDSTADGVLAVDDQGKVLHSNQRFAELWRIPQALIESGDDDVLLAFVLDQLADPDAFLAKVRSLYGSDEVDSDRIVFKDGRTFERFSVPMRMDGARIGRVWSFRDVSGQVRATADLLERERQYRVLFEAHPEPLWVYDRQTMRFLAVNEAAVKHYGWSRGEFLAKTIEDIRPPEDVPALRDFMDGIGRGLTESGVWRHVLSDGRVIFVEIGSHPLLFEGRDARLVVARDVTARREAERAVRRADAMRKIAADAARLGGWAVDLPTGRCELSEEVRRLLDVPTSEEAKVDEGIGAYCAEEWRETVAGHLMRCGRDGVPFDVEVQMQSRSGRRFWGRVMGEAERDADGEVIRIQGALQDIDERTQAAAALRESEERYRTLLQTAMDGFWLVDGEGRLLEVNETYCKMSGYEAHELLAMRITDLEVIESEAEAAAHIRKIMSQGEDRFDSQHRRKDGSVFDVAVSVQYRPVDGGRMVAFLQDVTARKQAEKEKQSLELQLQQSQKLESVGLLAGGVAHDFNNMLGVILGTADFALEQVDSGEPLHGDLVEIRKAAERSADLTRQLLAFARQQTVDPKVLDLNATVSEMVVMLRRLIGEDIQLEWDPAPGLWPITMDPSQVDQIVTNLCVNARAAIADVGLLSIATGNCALDEAFCATHVDAAPGDYVRLTVRDTGCGMDERTLGRIFEPFFTTKSAGEGTGLGLASVYGAVRQNGGFITVASAPGEGTTFDIYLPRRAEGDARATSRS